MTKPSEPVASTRHTIILTAILFALAVGGLLALHRAPAAPSPAPSGSPIPLYLGLIAAELGLLYYVRMGLRRRGHGLAGLISERPLTWRSGLADLALGLMLLALLVGAEWLLTLALGRGEGRLVQPLLVREAWQIPLWVVLAVVAGLSEEATFRGYYQRQLGAWLGSPWAGLAAQALLFGITHGYQGGAAMLKITVLGLLFGLAARLRRSLVPGIVAHAGFDIIGGLAALR